MTGERMLGLAKSAAHGIAQRGSVRQPTGKPPAFRQCHSRAPLPRRLEDSAFQPARKTSLKTAVLRKGRALPQLRRRSPGPDGPGRSRRSSLTELSVVWTSLLPSASGRTAEPLWVVTFRGLSRDPASQASERIAPFGGRVQPPCLHRFGGKAEGPLFPATGGDKTAAGG
jgi:hypothetical protein